MFYKKILNRMIKTIATKVKSIKNEETIIAIIIAKIIITSAIMIIIIILFCFILFNNFIVLCEYKF